MKLSHCDLILSFPESQCRIASINQLSETCFFQGLQDANLILRTPNDFNALVGICDYEALVTNAHDGEEELINLGLALEE